MTPVAAQRIIEAMRKGIPPDGFVQHFTVGRASEIASLIEGLANGKRKALLLQGNYGSGKTHLLRFIREWALTQGFAVSMVSLDSKSGVRFNRMDQIFGAVCRNIEIPQPDCERGIRGLLDLAAAQIEAGKSQAPPNQFWATLTNDWKWDYSDSLKAPAMYVALRAWCTKRVSAQDIVEDWLLTPAAYKNQRQKLFDSLIVELRQYFRDRRQSWQFFADGVFIFDKQGYAQSWGALNDIHVLATASGLRGLIILFDEFEDVITNLGRVDYQQAAFWNLFQFYSGTQFPGMTCFAVTPEFTHKCKRLLLNKGVMDYDYAQFDALPKFEMTPLTTPELEDLSERIMETHGLAYGWEPDVVMKASDFDALVQRASSTPVQDRARHTIKTVVRFLDRLLEGPT